MPSSRWKMFRSRMNEGMFYDHPASLVHCITRQCSTQTKSFLVCLHRLNQLKPDWRWQLTPSGRVAHRKQYVEDVARAHSFDITLYEKLDDFRAENGKGVRGHMFVLKKHAERKDEL